MKFIIVLAVATCIGFAKPTYTGYSGASGSKGTCASSCHGSGTGSITISGLPVSYEPLQTYTITVAHSSGLSIVNFNASTRTGSTASGAGSFGAGSLTSTYSVSGTESGIHSNSQNFDSAAFTWTAPAVGTGAVTFSLAGLQGGKTGPNTKLTVAMSEAAINGIDNEATAVSDFRLQQNYPNPFNPATMISYSIAEAGNVQLTVYDNAGREVRTLINGYQMGGKHEIQFNGDNLASGIYFYRLTAGKNSTVKKMLLLK